MYLRSKLHLWNVKVFERTNVVLGYVLYIIQEIRFGVGFQISILYVQKKHD